MNRTLAVQLGVFCLLLVFLWAAHAGDLPDPALTPGATREVSLDTLCHTSTKTVRHTTQATKRAVYTKYGIAQKHDPSCTGPANSCYEIDHLIALTDGGADVEENLWPQLFDTKWGARKKDALEVRLHALICNGTMTIEAAQACISTDWIACYKEIFP